MSVDEAIEARRTVRAFDRGVTEEQLRELLSAGIKAPSGSNVQPWAFILVDEAELIEQIAEHKYRQTLKMVLDETVLRDPSAIEQIYQQSRQRPLSPRRALGQRDIYRNCTVLAVCNQVGHGIGRKPWMNIENIASTWMCIENIALAATARGLGVVPSIFREEHKIAVEKLLHIADGYELTTILLLGVQTRSESDAKTAPRRRPLRLFSNSLGSGSSFALG